MIPRGLTARIAGFHPAGPGSTPGVGRLPFSALILIYLISRYSDSQRGKDKANFQLHMIPRGLTARIAGFHPAGPGSTPGVGRIFLFIFSFLYYEANNSINSIFISYINLYKTFWNTKSSKYIWSKLILYDQLVFVIVSWIFSYVKFFLNW